MHEIAQTPAAPPPSPAAAAPCPQPAPTRGALPLAAVPVAALVVDAGIAHARLVALDRQGETAIDTLLAAADLRAALLAWRTAGSGGASDGVPVVVTGKLAPLVAETLGAGRTIPAAAAAWLAARDALAAAAPAVGTLAIVELSASGYLVLGVDRSGALHQDTLRVNPRCGAGSGINLDRVLQKLGLARGDVDALLAEYAGEAGRARRAAVTVRTDRCGVFASSATVSDKNQGIPLAVALAVTLKSEVLKACRKLPAGFDQVYLTGRVFHWRFACECAQDFLRAQGVREIACDPDNSLVAASLCALARRAGAQRSAPAPRPLRPPAQLDSYPALADLKARYEAGQRYLRLPDLVVAAPPATAGRRLLLALDVGSTMAKAVLADADSGEPLWLDAASNAGDTMQTVGAMFGRLAAAGGSQPPLAAIGVTGSARYQVQRALEHLYPELAGRVSVLVENYAHARGSIALARSHVARLRAGGVAVNEQFFILVDVGGEDTKVSTVALGPGELFGNAMNLKCSAGTGSLMDTLAAMIGIGDPAAACAEAFAAPRGFAINATCAVFLMENARRLQLAGTPRGEILASAVWAIVENMARSLWNQLELPPRAVVLLHGQTMCSEPLPLAVTHRLHAYLRAPCHALVPPNPGHRACFGLIETLRAQALPAAAAVPLARLTEARFERRIVECHGAACGDPAACCNRSRLTCRDRDGRRQVAFTIGGCSAVNELRAGKARRGEAAVRDTYREIWDFIDRHHPRSDDAARVVIPRSFAVTEWGYLLARLLERLGLPAHVDNVREADLMAGQPLFTVDTCAPHIGAAGQFLRLAAEPHGMILAPQIDFLPTGGVSLGRSCTVNQGGIGVAVNLARLAQPQARFLLFSLDLSRLDAAALARQLGPALQPLFDRYRIAPTPSALHAAAAAAIDEHRRLRAQAADLAADLAEQAQAAGVRIALAVGREYILNPGLYDSHVRRLLRDQNMAVLPSYVLDVELNPDWSHLYWRNPHAFVSLLDAVARRQLHLRLRHPRLRAVFRRIEEGPDLLPVVQVSTFCCGPDSVVQPFIAEIMRSRPFLLIQSDATIKELAHLENRVNTYVRQLDLGLHRTLRAADAAFEIRRLDELVNARPIDRATDLLCLPTLGDNRVITAVLRGAGYACLDNYDERGFDLAALVRSGRCSTGDAVCTPMAAVYGDLQGAVEDFARRRRHGDPLVAGRTRLLFFENKGTGPCRQGQYFDAHRLLFHRDGGAPRAWEDPGRLQRPGSGGEGPADTACGEPSGKGLVQFLVGLETQGFDVGLEPWVLARVFQGAILHGVLQGLYLTGGAQRRDRGEFGRFEQDFRALKQALYAALERFHGPGPAARALLRGAERAGAAAWLVKYFAWRLHGGDLVEPLRRFAARWIEPWPDRAVPGRAGFACAQPRQRPAPAAPAVRIVLTGEVYMRAAQAEEIFRLLLANLGFGRFEVEATPVWSYLEYLLDYEIDQQRQRIDRLAATAEGSAELRQARGRLRACRGLRWLLRQAVARPLYRAARLPLPLDAGRAAALTREVLPTLRPAGELVTYVGEAIHALRHGADLVLNVGPATCMVATMGEALSPAIEAAAGGSGRVQQLFSADGLVDEEALQLALLRAIGPQRYCGTAAAA